MLSIWDFMVMKRTEEVIIGKLRKSLFFEIIEDINRRHPEWAVCVDLKKSGLFGETWVIETQNSYIMSNVIYELDSRI